MPGSITSVHILFDYVSVEADRLTQSVLKVLNAGGVCCLKDQCLKIMFDKCNWNSKMVLYEQSRL